MPRPSACAGWWPGATRSCATAPGVKNEVHGILAAHLVPPCPHVDPFNGPGRAWLDRQALPDDERAAITRHLRELDRLGEDLAVLDRDIGETVVDNPDVKRLLTIAGVNVTVGAGLVAAIGDIHRFSSPQKLVSCFGLNPRVRRSGLGLAQHGRISKIGRAHARAMLVEAALRRRRRQPFQGRIERAALDGRRPRLPARCMPSSSASARAAAIRSRPWRRPARWRCWSGIC
jgi:transposase